MTSKLQVTLPKSLAKKFGIRPGSEIIWQETGEAIRVLPPARIAAALDITARLARFNAATERQRERNNAPKRAKKIPTDRGWRREELYKRGASR